MTDINNPKWPLDENNQINKAGGSNGLLETIVFDLIPGKDIRLEHPSQKKLPLLPKKIDNMFPAIKHVVFSAKWRILDNWRRISWFDNEEEAMKTNIESEKEAESFYLTKDFFKNLKGTEKQEIIKINYPDISAKSNKDEIMQYGDIKNYKFVDQVSTYYSSDRSDDRIGMRGASSNWSYKFREFLFKDEELLISTSPNYGSPYDDKHYYEIALENGADKGKLDKKIIDSYNTRAEQIQQEIKKQWETIDFHFMKNYWNLPKVFGSHIHLSKAIEECRKLIDEKHSINSIDEYWEVDIPFKYTIDELNNQFTQWNEFWKGSFDNFNENIEKQEIIANYGGHFRHGGCTRCQDYWVIRPNGDLRPATSVEYRKAYFCEGEKNWDVVLPEEIAISWAKSNTGANHFFEINKMPKELTTEQEVSIKSIQDELEKEWSCTVGISGSHSPSIGNGWLWLIDEIDEIDDSNVNTIHNADDIVNLLSTKFGNVQKFKK